jgi:hypothetical protein
VTTVQTLLTYKFSHICVMFGLYLPTSLDISVSSLGCTYKQVWTVVTYKFGQICVMFGLYLPTSWIVLTYKFGHICV